MTAIGIDTHKATLAACAIDGLGLALDERTFRNDPAGGQGAWEPGGHRPRTLSPRGPGAVRI